MWLNLFLQILTINIKLLIVIAVIGLYLLLMKAFNEHESVIYTDADGSFVDTFVVFDTDTAAGLTHINHMDLKVATESLQLHPASIAKYNLPMQDAFSFEIFKKLKAKYTESTVPIVKRTLTVEPGYKLANAS
jgi:hypothetical protein